jgi:hypothetical protein
MPTLARNVEFLSKSKHAKKSGGGFESGTAAPPPKPEPTAPPSTEQLARVTDLFIHGVISPEQAAKARASRGGFEAIIGKNEMLPASFLEIGAACSRACCLIRTSGVDFLGRQGSWFGTGFLISPNILLTNNHVLNSPEVAGAGSAVFNYQLGIDGGPPVTKSFRLRPDRLLLTSPAKNGLD